MEQRENLLCEHQKRELHKFMHTRVPVETTEFDRLEDLAKNVTIILWRGCECKPDNTVVNIWGVPFNEKQLLDIAKEKANEKSL